MLTELPVVIRVCLLNSCFVQPSCRLHDPGIPWFIMVTECLVVSSYLKAVLGQGGVFWRAGDGHVCSSVKSRSSFPWPFQWRTQHHCLPPVCGQSTRLHAYVSACWGDRISGTSHFQLFLKNKIWGVCERSCVLYAVYKYVDTCICVHIPGSQRRSFF